MDKFTDFEVLISNRELICKECGETLAPGTKVTSHPEKGILCLACAGLKQLVFLPSGNTALTRRARKYSTLAAVVVKRSSRRKRYERQGLLIEPEALARAEKDCLDDQDIRAQQRQRQARSREETDKQYRNQFAERVRELFPQCPVGREFEIAEHACLKYSGRVGRSAAGRSLDENAVRLAVVAHIRHVETEYDRLLEQGYDRELARNSVRELVTQFLTEWGPRD